MAQSTEKNLQLIKDNLREVPDFPKEGILFKDVTTLFMNPEAYNACLEELYNKVKDLNIDVVAGIESRGFILGFALAQKLNKPFVMIRKAGKLPAKKEDIFEPFSLLQTEKFRPLNEQLIKISYSYDLEYGSATIEIHEDQIKEGQNVLIHDDLLATGGTAQAAAELIQQCKGKVSGFCFIIGLGFLNGYQVLSQYSPNIISLIVDN